MHHSGKKLILLIFAVQLFALPILLIASRQRQETRSQALEPSVGLEESEADLGNSILEESFSSTVSQEALIPGSNQTSSSSQLVPNNRLSKEVYGFIPYWEVNSQADDYIQYKYLTTLAYFGIPLKNDGTIRKDGNPWKVWNGEIMRKITQNARKEGVKIHPAIVLFKSSNLATLLNSETNRKLAVVNIMEVLTNSPNPVDGVNIDFETVASSERDEFLEFIKDLRTQMKAHNPSWTLIIDTLGSSADSEKSGLSELAKHSDGFFIMSYHFKDPKKAKTAGSKNEYKALERVVNRYLKRVTADKIILGFPLYTSGWYTKDDSLRSESLGGAGQKLHRTIAREIKGITVNYDPEQKSAWYARFCNNRWEQVYYDNRQAFNDKFGLITGNGLQGVGFWAFNQDKTSLDSWNAIYDSFADKFKMGAPLPKPGFAEPQPDTACPPPSTSPTPTTSPSATPTSSPSPGQTQVTLSVGLHGIGNTGDGSFPNANSGNKNPKKQKVNFKIDVFAPDQTPTQTLTKELTYRSSSGKYEATFNLNLPSNFYNFYVTSPGYLRKRIDFSLRSNIVNNIPSFNLSTGDVDLDQKRSILDWNIIRACSEFERNRNKNLCPDNSAFHKVSDLDSTGIVNQDDLTLWIHEFTGGSFGD